MCKFYIGFCGTAEEIVAVAEFFSRPETTKAPKVRNLSGAILTEQGNIFYFDSYDKWLAVKEPYFAIGSGAAYALGALHNGASVKEAIKIASKKDPFTGMGITVFNFKK